MTSFAHIRGRQDGQEEKAQPEDAGIDDIVVTSLRLKLKHGTNRKITLQADTRKNANAVHELLCELDPPPFTIDQVVLKVIYPKEIGKRARSKTVTITRPNRCNLNHDGKDDVIRKILAASGIVKHAPEDSST